MSRMRETVAAGVEFWNDSCAPAVSDEKFRECLSLGKAMKRLLELDIKPRDIITPKSIENAVTMVIALGGSTNAVLHLIAIAKAAHRRLARA